MILKGKNLVYKIEEATYHCPMDITMSLIGGKWKASILWYLRDGALRFTALRKLMPEITEKMLSIQLKQLEEDGLIGKEVFGIKPPVRVEYSLSATGATLLPALKAISRWGRQVGKKNGRLISAEVTV